MRSAVLLALVAVVVLGACTAPGPRPKLTFGPNPVFDTEPEAAPGARLIVTDLMLEPNAVGEAHFHPWEEFLYVIGGSAIVELRDQPSHTVLPGERFVIPPRVVHTPRAGPQGVRAIVVRVHREGDPVSVPFAP